MKILSDKKYDLSAFFNRLIEQSTGDINKGIDIDVVNDTAKAVFGKILSKEELNIFRDGLDKDNSSSLDFKEIMLVLSVAMKDSTDRLKAYFSLVAAILDKKKTATGN